MENLLFEKVTIKRRTLGADDSNGNPTYTNTTIITDAPCRTYTKHYTDIIEGQAVVKEVNKIALLYRGIQIEEEDTAIVNSLNYKITRAYIRYAGSIPHHWELEVKIIKG